jgi:hypothetical protein
MADIKAKLQQKNSLIRADRKEGANAPALLINNKSCDNIFQVSEQSTLRLTSNMSNMYSIKCVNLLTGKSPSSAAVPGITAEVATYHNMAISNDHDYVAPTLKLKAAAHTDDVTTEWQVFNVLDSLRHTSTGLDQLPAW